MQRRRVLIPLLFVAVAAVDLIAVTIACDIPNPKRGWYDQQVRWPDVSVAVYLALICGQASLLGVWCGVARRPLPWPVTATAIASVAWGVVLSRPSHLRAPTTFNAYDWPILLSLQALAVAGPLWMFRMWGVRLVDTTAPQSPDPAQPGRPGQFSIAHMLSWMAAVAVVLGFATWACHPFIFRWHNDMTAWPLHRHWLEIALIAAGNMLLAWTILWAVLIARGRQLGAAAPIVATLLVILAAIAKENSLEYRRALTTFCAVQGSMLLVALGIVRIDGYRLGGKPNAEDEKRRTGRGKPKAERRKRTTRSRKRKSP